MPVMPSRARRSILPLMLGGLVSMGCLSPVEIVYQVSDPSLVSVEVATPAGARALVPPGREPREAVVPRSVPPYHEEVRFAASGIRAASGAIDLLCDACQNVPVARVLAADGHGQFNLHGADEDRPRKIKWTSDELRIGNGYDYYRSAGRSSTGPYTAFDYEIVTPRSNVVSMHEHRDDVRSQGVFALLIGIPLSALAVGLIIDGAHRSTGSGTLETALGVAAAVPALPIDLLGAIFALQPPGYDRSLMPDSPR